MSTHETILKEIDSFLARHNMRPTTFGLNAVNDAKLVGNLRAGLDIRTRTLDRIRAYMRRVEGNGKTSKSTVAA